MPFTQNLLSPDEWPSWTIERESGSSPLLILCDHASNCIPRGLATLGLDQHELQRHIAWDIGAAGVASRLGEALDATVILQRYSRLVIDCNRPLGHVESIVRVSERTRIPGNQSVSPQQQRLRESEIFEPYHHAIRAHLDARAQRGQPTLLLALHSFTPMFMGEERPWHVGLLYNRDPRMARLLGAALRRDPQLVVGDNQPYVMSDDADYAIPVYGEQRGLPHVELEIRQDLIADEPGQIAWALSLAHKLREVIETLTS